MSYLEFKREPGLESGKTQVWSVWSTRGAWLGEIRWYGPWRQYTFAPGQQTTFNPDCLREVADRCATMTREKARR